MDVTNDLTPTEPVAVPHLNRVQRRILGVLVEKAKTTPESYPLSLNALTNGCNQKSNRSPQMNLASDDIELELDNLRELGAVVEVQTGGRVAKYRHRIYDWLQVDRVEAAILAELLLRGEQTVGELRGRASRMETIADLGTLKPILKSLIEREFVISLTAEGRGQIVTHGLYETNELERIRRDVGKQPTAVATTASPPATPVAAAAPAVATPAVNEELEELRDAVSQLQQQMLELQDRVLKLEQ